MVMMTGGLQPCVLPMYFVLENRSPAKFARSMRYSYFFLTIIFSLFSFTAYATYGPSVAGTVTNSLRMARAQNLLTCVGMTFFVLRRQTWGFKIGCKMGFRLGVRGA